MQSMQQDLLQNSTKSWDRTTGETEIMVHQDSREKRIRGHNTYHIIELYVILLAWCLRFLQFYVSLIIMFKAQSYYRNLNLKLVV